MLRFLGYFFIYLSLAIFGMEVVAALTQGRYSILSIGEQWFAFGPDGLTGFSNFLMDITPWLWDPVFLTLLKIPAWSPFLILGLFFILYAKRRNRRKRMFA